MQNLQMDEDLYNRQLYVLGHEAMKKMQDSNVLILGLDGLGVEVAKNIILAGVKSVGILDQTIVKLSDFSSQFYLKTEHVGKTSRAEASQKDLQKLNRYVEVKLEKSDQSPDKLSKLITQNSYNVVVASNLLLSESLKIDQLCRDLGVKFIAADVHGLYGSVFVDNGDSFEVLDKDDKSPETGMIASISNDQNALVTCLDEVRHGLESGDYVRISEVKGMEQVNGTVKKVSVIGPYTFRIDDTTKFGLYCSGGVFTQVKRKEIISFKSLKDSLESPECLVSDFAKMEYPKYIHSLHIALNSFKEKLGRFPLPYELEESREVVKRACEVFMRVFGAEIKEKLKASNGSTDMISDKNPQEEKGENGSHCEKQSQKVLEEGVIKNLLKLSRCSSAVIAPMTSVIGGIAAQEVMKALSGKFMPIRQHFYYDAIECHPSDVSLEEFKPVGSRYDDSLAIFGKKVVNDVKSLRVFLIGAGAIGCEMLKNWAMMGLACGPESKSLISVTDMDMIEKSNLSRQFLFRNEDVSKLKSTVAAQSIQKMNPDIKICAQSNRVGKESENLYNRAFWENLDIACTALDNVETRLYVDERCVYFKKPLFDSGTLGTKGNTQVVIPHKTESYGSSRDPPEKSIPMCTLKNFPNKIEHTIQWARDLFEGLFKQSVEDSNAFLKRKGFPMDSRERSSIIKETTDNIESLLGSGKSESFDDCIRWARLKFEELFRIKIEELLFAFPLDHTTTSGSKFWSGPKRAPKILKFDINDPLHLSFIKSSSNLRAFINNIPQNQCTSKQILDALKTVSLPKFTPSTRIKIATTDEELKKQSESAQYKDMPDLEVFSKRIFQSSRRAQKNLTFIPCEFEKDVATNFHMSFVTACANLRARNYSIEETSLHKCKLIAGKIIPAIATTTSIVSGLVCLEMYKYVLKKKLEEYKNGFLNLSIPFFTFSEPMPPAKTKSMIEGKEWNFTLWDTIDIKEGNLTLKDFLDYFEKKLKIKVQILLSGPSMIYASFFNPKNFEDSMNTPLIKAVEETRGKKLRDDEDHVVLEANVCDLDNNEVEIPTIRFFFKS